MTSNFVYKNARVEHRNWTVVGKENTTFLKVKWLDN